MILYVMVIRGQYWKQKRSAQFHQISIAWKNLQHLIEESLHNGLQACRPELFILGHGARL